MEKLFNLIIWVRNFFFPGSCPFCGSSLVYFSEMRCGLCDKCRLSLNPLSGNTCNFCGKPLVSEKDVCLLCRKIDGKNVKKPSYERMRVLFPYTGKYKKLLAAYKFSKNLRVAEIFTEKILQVIKTNSELKDAVIVPVPPRKGKIKQSGWDQVDYLARKLSKIKFEKINVTFCLKRKKSKVQKKLNRNDRMDNLKGRIYAYKTVPEKVLLLDDVITTGSTMEVCSSVLKEAGAREVYGLCLFYD